MRTLHFRAEEVVLVDNTDRVSSIVKPESEFQVQTKSHLSKIFVHTSYNLNNQELE